MFSTNSYRSTIGQRSLIFPITAKKLSIRDIGPNLAWPLVSSQNRNTRQADKQCLCYHTFFDPYTASSWGILTQSSGTLSLPRISECELHQFQYFFLSCLSYTHQSQLNETEFWKKWPERGIGPAGNYAYWGVRLFCSTIDFFLHSQ